MPSCLLDKDTPEFQRLVNELGSKYGEELTVALVSHWREGVQSQDVPTAQQVKQHFQDIKGEKTPMGFQQFYTKLVASLTKNWEKPKGETGEDVVGLLRRFKVSTFLDPKDTANNLAETALRNLLNSEIPITPELIADAIVNLNRYLLQASEYLQKIDKHLKNFLKSDYTVHDKLRTMYYAFELAQNYRKQINAIFPQMMEEFLSDVPKNNFILDTKTKVNGFIESIEQVYERDMLKYVTQELANNNELNVEIANKHFDAIITGLSNLKQSALEKGNDKAVKLFDNKLKEALFQQEQYTPTEANIKNWLGKNQGETVYSLYMRSGVENENATIQTIARYILDVYEGAQRQFNIEFTDLHNIMKDIEKESGEKIDARNIYTGLYRETIDENGNYALAIQTEMQEQELSNEKLKLLNAVKDATTEQESALAKEDYAVFQETYEERKYLPEYYELRKMLPERIRTEMNQRRHEVNIIRELIDPNDIDSEDVFKLKLAEKHLKDLGKEFDDFGKLKSDDEVVDARLIQEYNKKAEERGIHDFYLSSADKLNFENSLKEQKEKLATVLGSDASEEDKDAAQEQYDNWAAVYARTDIDIAWYELRASIMKKIEAISTSYGKKDSPSISREYTKVFALLSGYRDQNNIYEGTRIPEGTAARVRDLEVGIEVLRQSQTKMTDEDSKALRILFQQLRNIQTSSVTDYYLERTESEKNAIRSELVNQKVWADAEVEDLETKVAQLYQQSDWFKLNHIWVIRGSEEDSGRWEPLIIWKATFPSEYAEEFLKKQVNEQADKLLKDYGDVEDPVKERKLLKHIQNLRDYQTVRRESPSKLWYSYRVNSKFDNPNYSPDIKFKGVPNSPFYNPEWVNLSPAKKDIATRLLDYYRSLQDGLYYSSKLRTLIPYVRKEAGELLYDSVFTTRGGYIRNTLNTIKTTFKREDLAFDNVEEVYGNANQIDVFGNPLSRLHRAIYVRYITPLDKNLMSHDIMKSIGLFMGEAIKFKTLREHQVEVNSMQKVLESTGETTATKTIAGLIDRVLHGENVKRYKTKATRNIQTIVRALSRMAGRMSISQNIESAVKNLVAGELSAGIHAGVYDVSLQQLAKGNLLATQAVKDWLANPQHGNKPLSLQLLDYFSVIQGKSFEQGKNIKSTFFRKYGNILKTTHRFREWSEFQIQAGIGFAVLDQYYADDGNTVKMQDAFHLVSGKITIKDGLNVSNQKLKHIRAKIKKMNHNSQGLYDQIYQPEGSKHFWYAMLLFMRKYWQPAMDSRFRKKHYNIEAGIELTGAYRVITDYLYTVYKNKAAFTAAFQALTSSDKKAFGFVMKDTMVLTGLIALLIGIRGGDDDEDKNYKDYLNWVLRGVEDEVETLHPVLLPVNFAYGFIDQKTQFSASEKIIMTAFPAGSKIWRIITDPSLRKNHYIFGHYEKKKGKKINWDVSDPMFAGRHNLAVLFLKFSGFGTSGVSPTEAEFKARQLNYYNPKIFLDRPKTIYINKDYDKVKIKK